MVVDYALLMNAAATKTVVRRVLKDSWAPRREHPPGFEWQFQWSNARKNPKVATGSMWVTVILTLTDAVKESGWPPLGDFLRQTVWRSMPQVVAADRAEVEGLILGHWLGARAEIRRARVRRTYALRKMPFEDRQPPHGRSHAQ